MFWTHYLRLMRFDKPIGIFLLLWPTLWSLWIAAKGPPRWLNLIIFILGVIVMRAAGCIINDIADHRIDSQVSRTAARPLARRIISISSAFILFVVLSILALTLVLCLNFLTIKLAFIGFLLATIYPFMKRWTHWPQAFLGLAFAWGIPMAFAAEIGSVPMLAWELFAITFLWVIVYDTQYAMVDREDDIKIGVKSTAILFAGYDRLIIALLQLVVLVSLASLGYYLQLKIYFYLGLLAAAVLAVYQQYLIRQRQPKACFKAFLNNHWFGCVIFLGICFGF